MMEKKHDYCNCREISLAFYQVFLFPLFLVLVVFGRSTFAQGVVQQDEEESDVSQESTNEVSGPKGVEQHSSGKEGEEEVFEEEIVITGTRTRKPVTDAPVKTEVIRKEKIESKGAVNLVEAVEGEPGLKVDNQCSICNTTSIKIGGAPGRYTLLLVDSMPVYSSLGQTYGLLNISTAGIERIEIVHGSSSVLYGTDAIGGVINVLTRQPSRKPHANFVARAGMYGFREISGYGSMMSGPVGISVVATHSAHDKVDRDGDRIDEFAGYVRSTASGSVLVRPLNNLDVLIKASVAHEKRQGGALGSFLEVLNDYDADNFTGRRALTESILTERMEGGLVINYSPFESLRFETVLSGTYHDQDSDYEGEVYHAYQYIFFANETVHSNLHPRYELVGGIAYRLEYLNENLAVANYTYHMPGLYLQGDWIITKHLEFVHGGRYDYHNSFGNVFTGRSALKLSMFGKKLVARAGIGTGFRTPTTFYEYAHGVRAEGYKFINDCHSPEKAVSGNLSLTLDLGRKFFIVLEQVLTRINHAITIENTPDGHIRTFNVNEPLDIHSLEVKAQSQALQWLVASFGYGWYHYIDKAGALVTAPPVHQFTAGFEFNFVKIGLKASVFVEVYSPMELRRVYGYGYNALKDTELEGWLDVGNADLANPKLKRSPWYAVADLKIEKRVYKDFSLFAGVKNIFDYHQCDVESPLYYPADEKGNPQFADVTYIWGPLRGRFIYGGLKFEI